MCVWERERESKRKRNSFWAIFCWNVPLKQLWVEHSRLNLFLSLSLIPAPLLWLLEKATQNVKSGTNHFQDQVCIQYRLDHFSDLKHSDICFRKLGNNTLKLKDPIHSHNIKQRSTHSAFAQPTTIHSHCHIICWNWLNSLKPMKAFTAKEKVEGVSLDALKLLWFCR